MTGRHIFLILTIFIVSYFGYHYYHGKYGFVSRRAAEKRIEFLTKERIKLEQQCTKLEKQVSSLRDGTIEKDVLDEYVRKTLDFSRPDELIILLKKHEKIN